MITGIAAPELTKEYIIESPGDVYPDDILSLSPHVYPTEESFYMWYKESVPNEKDNEILSDEYELLYQSVKRNEYKPQLKIYVVTYSVCLAVMIVLMLFSPFLSEPINYLRNSSIIADKNSNKSGSIDNHKKELNPYFNMKSFADEGQKPLNDVLSGTVARSITPEEPGKPNTETVDGMLRNSIGFTDLKNKVIYIPLPNGKYSIQESSWNNEQKALNRINTLNKLGIKSSNGSIVKALFEKADIVDKGVWYRTRVGEFNTIEEAKQTAEFIRKENTHKNIASLYIFPVSNLKV